MKILTYSYPNGDTYFYKIIKETPKTALVIAMQRKLVKREAEISAVIKPHLGLPKGELPFRVYKRGDHWVNAASGYRKHYHTYDPARTYYDEDLTF